MKAAGGARVRHLPQRTCIACRQEGGKRTLVRLVRSADARVLIDPTGRASGRGAYLHASRSCWEKALKGSSIKNALKITPAPNDVEALRDFATALPAEESETL
jgi:uncharacterized protein